MTAGASGLVAIEVGPDVVLRIPADVTVERAAAPFEAAARAIGPFGFGLYRHEKSVGIHPVHV